MDKVFEKITLYDILGYVFPGCFLMIILLVDFFISNTEIAIKAIKATKGYDAIIIMLALIISHIFGTIISQISESSDIAECLFPRQALKKETNDDELIKELTERIDKEAIKKALENEGGFSCEGSSCIEVNKKATDYIYNVIQVDPDYSRIHGYASSEVLSRNSSLVCLIGFITTCSSIIVSYQQLLDSLFIYEAIILAGALIVGFLVLKERSERFAKKKVYYAVNWFVSKYKKKRNN